MTAFAVMLGAPNVVVGAFPAVMTLGWQLPSLFAAGHTQSLRPRISKSSSLWTIRRTKFGRVFPALRK